jgi:hypothetical protein
MLLLKAFLGGFTKLQKRDYELRYVCSSVHMEQLRSHWTEFDKIRYLKLFQKCVEKIQVSLKSDKNNGYFT